MLNEKGLGLAIGVITAAYIFLMGLAAAWFGWGVDAVNLIATYYQGYGASFVGAIVGAVWGFVDGFICGWLIAWLYNKFSK
ncbi:hypothetical protein A3G56_00165 [Candidatus Falkowbacteria bacterium RIFCSPLOWO2_12_FULL_45_10]|uniref:Membrane-associated protein n=3 Tax=Candidatus Falkowiibacteriota TaxID=1752728 RepID=A0A1F5RVK7_9BACT|nr:MAG: hypothetical protein A3D54_00530 [Candidatus Falkowbacteria bacterium RIFCSPHIGHO2_02_FULL_45_15]OGF18758.1 MAG: hypothetical protein A3I35_00635 [Candidatus Falkowbacteria bacterium RIFCSPLOWO2_02_FULL_45_15]OGF19659.1 MAG: hypothetical protein A3G56_00165 [Candidatus Falkowbacteria bacterium RIFCSPLOWO2_12_FULL_45_10]